MKGFIIKINTDVKAFRFHYLDFLRLVAAFGVVLFHVASSEWFWTSRLYLMVDLFFVLSGFVLAPAFPKSGNVRGLVKFLQKRLLRLVPMAWISIFFVLSYSHLLIIRISNNGNPDSKVMHINFLSSVCALLFLQIFSNQALLINYPLWSLSAELLANIIIAIPINFLKSQKAKMVTLCTFPVTILIISLLIQVDSLRMLARAIFGIGLGILVRIYFERRKKTKKIFLKIGITVVCIVLILYPGSNFRINLSVASSLIFAYFIYLLAVTEFRFGLRAGGSFASLCGSISFGLYVWHAPLSGLVDWLLEIVHLQSLLAHLFLLVFSGIAASLVTIFLVERPVKSFIKGRVPTLSD